ncbi:GNAT family N-acetyltransferase [Bradyrhizobium sp. 157]|uniref:GNAT family N-acetyltransferase n=1 Tax=Bradyrhizobium sp. 157 TaxID=2782631 RepID=UPI001FF9E3F1
MGLETAWKALEERATHSFFLSWLWIGTWLRQLPKRAKPHVLIARDCGRIVGLAIVCPRGTWRLGPRSRTRWLLHETGDASFDRLYIEYNGILVDRSMAESVTAACLETLVRRLRRADQLVLSGIEPTLDIAACRAAGGAGLLADLKGTETAHWIDFAKLRLSGKDYRAALGRNTRQAVSRAMRLYAERGPVEHRIMETPSEALAAFDLLAGFHQARWGRRGAFANPGFCPFHEDLIARGVPAGAVRMSRTLAGDRTIGVLYNFVHDGQVVNYQSGFLYERDPRLKPGLVSHVLSVEDSIARGERSYDFMAGSAGHKSRLANAQRSLKWIVVSRDTLERRVETTLRRASRALGALRQRAD